MEVLECEVSEAEAVIAVHLFTSSPVVEIEIRQRPTCIGFGSREAWRCEWTNLRGRGS